MSQIKMHPFIYKNMRVRVLKDILGFAPFYDVLIAKGTEVRIQKTVRNRHYVKIEGKSMLSVGVDISDTKIVYP